MFIKVKAFKDQVLYNAPDPEDEEQTDGDRGSSGGPGGGNGPGHK